MQPNYSNNRISHYNVETSNIFGPVVQLISTKPVIKNKLKGLLSDLFKVWAVFFLDCKKRNNHKIFHWSTKLEC